jgi:hypothetical protein
LFPIGIRGDSISPTKWASRRIEQQLWKLRAFLWARTLDWRARRKRFMS